MFAGLIRNKLTALILGTFGYGFISVYNSATLLIANSTNLGISFSSVKNLSQLNAEGDKDATLSYIATIRFWGILTALLGTLICFLFSGLLSQATFENADYTVSFMLLAPVVGFTTFSACELSILKALRRLSEVAKISLYSALGSLIVIPIYYLYGVSGIVPALLILSIMVAMITVFYSSGVCKIDSGILKKENFKNGIPLLKLGISFVMAGRFISGAEYLIRAFIIKTGSIDDVGLYNAGYTI